MNLIPFIAITDTDRKSSLNFCIWFFKLVYNIFICFSIWIFKFKFTFLWKPDSHSQDLVQTQKLPHYLITSLQVRTTTTITTISIYFIVLISVRCSTARNFGDLSLSSSSVYFFLIIFFSWQLPWSFGFESFVFWQRERTRIHQGWPILQGWRILQGDENFWGDGFFIVKWFFSSPNVVVILKRNTHFHLMFPH